jgi:hypothetical protein
MCVGLVLCSLIKYDEEGNCGKNKVYASICWMFNFDSNYSHRESIYLRKGWIVSHSINTCWQSSSTPHTLYSVVSLLSAANYVNIFFG